MKVKKNGYKVTDNKDFYDRQVGNPKDYYDSPNKAFMFNGNNYLEVHMNAPFDFSNGLTMEFYGKVLGGKSSTITNSNDGAPFFSIWDGTFDHSVSGCFTASRETVDFGFSYFLTRTTGYEQYGSWDSEEYKPQGFGYWQTPPNIHIRENDDVYVCVTIDPRGATLGNQDDASQNVIQKVFVNSSNNNGLQSQERNISQ